MSTIVLDKVSFSYPTHQVLQDISLRVGAGERACLVGPNGCGKTTLLRIAAGILTPDQGTVAVTGDSPPLMNEATDTAATVGEYLEVALQPLHALAARFEQLSCLLSRGASVDDSYAATLAQMNNLDVWSLEARVAETLAGLGLEAFTGLGQQRSLDSLSLGQRARLRLAATLILRPGVLILDEPTNHLDAAAIDFLTQTIKDWDGAVLIASHDRAFIEDTATVIYDLDTQVWQELHRAEGGELAGGLYRCAGNYSYYLQAKTSARARHTELHEAQQAEKRRLAAHRKASTRIARGGVRLATAEGKAKKFFADRAQTTATRRLQNDKQRLAALARQEVRKPRYYQLAFPLGQTLGQTLRQHSRQSPRQSSTGQQQCSFQVQPGQSRHQSQTHSGLAVSVRNAEVIGRLAPTSFDLGYGEHLLVTGPNGCGKTTLLHWIASGTPPDDAETSGTIDRDPAIGYAPQRLPRQGDPGFTPETWQNGIGEQGRGILHPALWHTPIAELSDGNQRRTQLALALADTPAVLIIDEPTNYLDLDTIQALETALSTWPGTLIVASHDRWLLDHWIGRRLDLSPYVPPQFSAP